jgi:hypothetical protein
VIRRRIHVRWVIVLTRAFWKIRSGGLPALRQCVKQPLVDVRKRALTHSFWNNTSHHKTPMLQKQSARLVLVQACRGHRRETRRRRHRI